MRRLLILLFCLTMALAPSAQTNKQRVKKASTTATSKKKKQSTSKKKTTQTKKKNTTYTNSSIRGLQGQRAAVQKKIKEQEKALQANQQDVKRRLQELFVLNSEIGDRKKNIDDIEKDINHLNDNIAILQAQLNTLEAQLASRKAKYIQSMRFMRRRHSVQDKLMFIFSAESFSQMYRRLRFVRQYAAFQKAQGEAVMAKQEQVNAKQKQLLNAKKHKNDLLYKGKKEKEELEGKHAEQQEMVNGLRKQQKTIQGLIAQQRQKDAALNAQIDRLVEQEIAKARARAAAEAKRKAAAEAAAKKRAEELARKKAAAEAAARENARRIAEAKEREARLKAEAEAAAKAEKERREQAAAAESKKRKAEAERKAREAAAKREAAEQAAREARAAREAAELKARAEAAENKKAIARATEEAKEATELSTVDRMLSGGFESNRGRLPMPITGSYRIVSHFGQYNVEGLKGVKLDNKGINILGKSGCMARSIYDGEVSAVFGFGGTMVVMVRHGAYISVYCNLKSVSVQKGQKVSTRQALGRVGADNILQFQLRKERAKLNPETWLAR